jgi:hypothetical protein
VSARHRARAVVGEQRFQLIVSTDCSMATVALVRATSVMVAGQSSVRPSSAAGIGVVDGRLATVLGLWILIVTVLLARRRSTASLGTQ